MSMEFWGVEVKPGEPLVVHPPEDYVLHISQAALGEMKNGKGSQSACLYLKYDDKKLVLGTLSHEKFPQISLDLVIEREFQLSHSWKDGSVYFTGYTVLTSEDSEDEESDFEVEEELPLVTDNGKSEPKETKPKETKPAEAKPVDAKKPDATAAKQVNFVEPNKDVKAETEQADDSDDDEDYSEDEDDSSDDQGLTVDGEDDDSNEEDDDSDEEDDDSDESQDEDDVTPKKGDPSKKRSVDSATKTPVPNKKVKLDTPQKTDGKKVGGHTATPHPAKKAGKTLANSDQTKQQAQKSGGSYPCKSCNRSFGSEVGLQSHTKAKHGAAA